jgi:leucyl/phenylalanyl-tRNA--protein transferase
VDETEEQEIPNGLVAVGGSLDPDTLLRAYRSGIFPWSSEPAITWWCPDPRAVIELDDFQPSRSLRKQIRRAGWRFTVDRDFVGVMRACAEPTPERPSTWISEEFIESYAELHRRGFAHSVEVYQEEELVGGLYGVTIGGFFGGESMFRRRTDASKAPAHARFHAAGRAGAHAPPRDPGRRRDLAGRISRAPEGRADLAGALLAEDLRPYPPTLPRSGRDGRLAAAEAERVQAVSRAQAGHRGDLAGGQLAAAKAAPPLSPTAESAVFVRRARHWMIVPQSTNAKLVSTRK